MSDIETPKVTHGYGQECSEQYDGDGGGDEPQPVGAHRTEEARSHLQAQGVDENHQSETLGVGEHRRVERQPEMPGQDAYEEDEGRAERNPEEADFSQSDAERRDERNHHDGL